MSGKLDCSDERIIVPFEPKQGTIAIFTNVYSRIVMPEPDSHCSGDNFVMFRPEYAEAIVRAIIEEVGFPYILVPEPAENAGSMVRKAKDNRPRNANAGAARSYGRTVTPVTALTLSRASRPLSRLLALKEHWRQCSRAGRTTAFGQPWVPRLRAARRFPP